MMVPPSIMNLNARCLSIFKTKPEIVDDGAHLGSASLRDNGDVISGIGQGTYESTGKHRWATANIWELSDGRRIGNTGEIDLAARTWKGKITE
jgi:hypothetical protein